MQKITKITASVGPKSASRAVLNDMIRSGANAIRVNFSHDTGAVQGEKIAMVREISKQTQTPVAVIVDLQGPKHRIGDFQTSGEYKLSVGQHFVFDNNHALGDSTRVCLPHPDVMASLRVGDRILLDDGKLEMRVDSVRLNRIDATVVRGTHISSRRGFNLPDTLIETPILTDKDISDLEYAIAQEPDFVAVSFVQRATDISAVRDFITARTSRPIKIIAKIERPHAVFDIDDIASVSDAIMIARGDLAVEMPFEQVPAISRRIIRVCRKLNRPVIMATQMLSSMVDSEFPTRAEISDVATSAYLRVDSTMTSEETTVGVNPPHVIKTMAQILSYADMDTIANPYDWSDIDKCPENDWSLSVVSVARLNKVACIVVFDTDGNATTEISCRRPDIPVVSITNKQIVANQMCLCRGVYPIYDEALFGTRDAVAVAHKFGINFGDIVVVDTNRKITTQTIM